MGLRLTRGNEMAVILSEAKDLQLRSDANECRFFASLRMTPRMTFFSSLQTVSATSSPSGDILAVMVRSAPRRGIR